MQLSCRDSDAVESTTSFQSVKGEWDTAAETTGNLRSSAAPMILQTKRTKIRSYFDPSPMQCKDSSVSQKFPRTFIKQSSVVVAGAEDVGDKERSQNLTQCRRYPINVKDESSNLWQRWWQIPKNEVTLSWRILTRCYSTRLHTWQFLCDTALSSSL